MPKRGARAQYVRKYHTLVELDGELCQGCGRVPAELRWPLEIDHRDEDRDNWDIANLQLLCKQCNVSKSRRVRSSRKSGSPRSPYGKGRIAWEDMSKHDESGSPRNGGGTGLEAGDDHGEGAFISDDVKRTYVAHPRAIKEGLGVTQGTPQQRVNFYAEPRAVEWILEQVRVRGVVLKQDLSNGSAQVANVSPSTTASYLAKLVSSEGPLEESRNEFGDWVVAFRDSHIPTSGDATGDDLLMPLGHEEAETSRSVQTGPPRRSRVLGWLRRQIARR